MKTTIFIFLLTMFSTYSALAGYGITYHGKILKPDGVTPVTSSTTQFRMQIRSPGNCILWEEQQTKDLSSSNGIFEVTIADSSEPSLIANVLAFPLERVFSNRSQFSGLTGCTAGTTYNPNSTDGRSLVVFFRENPADSWEQMPLTKINFMPISLNTLQLSGYEASEFLKISSTSSYTPLTATQVNTLMDIITGTSSLYLKPATAFSGDMSGTYNTTSVDKIKGVNVSATAPTNGQVLKLVGGVWTPAADDSGSSPGDASYSAKGVVQLNTDLATSGLLISGGVLALPNVIVAGGPIGNAQTVPTITYDQKGRITAVSSATIDDTTKLPLAGGTMTGNINMGTRDITNVTNIAATTVSTRNLVLNDNDTNQITIKSPSNIAADYTLELPIDDGTNNQVLTTNGSGVLAWSSANNNLGLLANQAVIANGTGAALTNFTCSIGQVMGFDGAGIPTCTNITGSGGFLNGGNSFGASATLGTNDNFDLNFETNSTGRMTITNAGRVGIGTTSPDVKFEVAGGIKIANEPSSCSATLEGTLRYVSGNVEYCDGSNWKAFGIAGASITSLGGQTGSTQTFTAGSAGLAPGISSAGNVHTLNVPLASGAGVTSGTISKTDYDAFSAKLTSPLTTKGDLLTRDGSNHLRLPAGTDGQVLTADSAQSSGLKWASPSTGTVTSVTSANNYISIANTTTTPVITANVGTTADTLAAGNDSRILGALQSTDYVTDITPAASCTSAQTPYWSTVANTWLCQNISAASAGAFVDGGNTFTGTATLGTNSNHALEIETNGTTKMKVLADGSVGIGTTSPTSGLHITKNSAASIPAVLLDGTVFSGGTGTTTKPHFLIEPAGTTAGTNWSTNGTLIGVNAPSGFTGNLLDLKLNGNVSSFLVGNDGSVYSLGSFIQLQPNVDPQLRLGPPTVLTSVSDSMGQVKFSGTNSAWSTYEGAAIKAVATNVTSGAESSSLALRTIASGTLADRLYINSSGHVGIGTSSPLNALDVAGGVAIGSYAGTGTAGSGNLVVPEKIGIGTHSPTSDLEIRKPATSVTFVDTQNITATALTRLMPGLHLLSKGQSLTTPYGMALKFGSHDGAFTTENPKFLAAIVPRATQNYGSDTRGGMALDFATTPNTPGVNSVPLVRLTIDQSGYVGIGNTSPQAPLDITGHIANSGPTAGVMTCGTGATVTGNDTRGYVTTGTGTVTSCVITFAASYSTAPHCVVSWRGSGSPTTGLSSSASTGSLSIFFSASSPSMTVSYICIQ